MKGLEGFEVKEEQEGSSRAKVTSSTLQISAAGREDVSSYLQITGRKCFLGEFRNTRGQYVIASPVSRRQILPLSCWEVLQKYSLQWFTDTRVSADKDHMSVFF